VKIKNVFKRFKTLKQEAQLWRRDRATRCVIEILSPAAQLYEQLHLKTLAIGE